MIREPVEGPPKSQRIKRSDIPPRVSNYVKTDGSIGYPKTFDDEFWDDANQWYSKNIWGS